MAEKHSIDLRVRVEIAAACGISERKITQTLGVARTTQYRWLKAEGKVKAEVHRKNWVKKNPEVKARWNKKWRDNNPDKARIFNKKSYITHYNKNPHYYTEKTNIRRQKMRKWPCSIIERLMIQYKYEDARALSINSGIAYHVDHIWPLSKGGPHLPWNLQILTAQENLKKRDSI